MGAPLNARIETFKQVHSLELQCVQTAVEVGTPEALLDGVGYLVQLERWWKVEVMDQAGEDEEAKKVEEVALQTLLPDGLEEAAIAIWRERVEHLSDLCSLGGQELGSSFDMMILGAERLYCRICPEATPSSSSTFNEVFARVVASQDKTPENLWQYFLEIHPGTFQKMKEGFSSQDRHQILHSLALRKNLVESWHGFIDALFKFGQRRNAENPLFKMECRSVFDRKFPKYWDLALAEWRGHMQELENLVQEAESQYQALLRVDSPSDSPSSAYGMKQEQGLDLSRQQAYGSWQLKKELLERLQLLAVDQLSEDFKARHLGLLREIETLYEEGTQESLLDSLAKVQLLTMIWLQEVELRTGSQPFSSEERNASLSRLLPSGLKAAATSAWSDEDTLKAIYYQTLREFVRAPDASLICKLAALSILVIDKVLPVRENHGVTWKVTSPDGNQTHYLVPVSGGGPSWLRESNSLLVAFKHAQRLILTFDPGAFNLPDEWEALFNSMLLTGSPVERAAIARAKELNLPIQHMSERWLDSRVFQTAGAGIRLALQGLGISPDTPEIPEDILRPLITSLKSPHQTNDRLIQFGQASISLLETLNGVLPAQLMGILNEFPQTREMMTPLRENVYSFFTSDEIPTDETCLFLVSEAACFCENGLIAQLYRDGYKIEKITQAMVAQDSVE